VRTPLFRDRPSFRAPRRGPLVGRRVLVVVAPTECDARGVKAMWRALRPLGVRLGVTMECHGEARGEDGRPLFPDLLLVEVRPDDWDALVFAGGRGAAQVAEDQLAREVAQRFAAAGRIVAAFGDGRRVLAAARLDGVVEDTPGALAAALAARLGLVQAPATAADRRAPSGSAGPAPATR
jgi:putative intracellular protease/amidase